MKFPLRLLPVGGMHCVRIEGVSVLLCRTEGGVYAVENRCTHVDAALYGGTIEGEAIRCPMHGLKFDLRTGEPFTMGRMDNLTTYDVRIEDDNILIGQDEA